MRNDKGRAELTEGGFQPRSPKGKRELQVVEMATGEVVKRIDVSTRSDREIEKIEMGMLRNMDLERYSVNDTGNAP